MNINPKLAIGASLGVLAFLAYRASKKNMGMNDAPAPYMPGIPYFASNPSMYSAIPGIIGSPNAASKTPVNFDTSALFADISGYFERSMELIRAASNRIYVDNSMLTWMQAGADLGGPTVYYGQGGAGSQATITAANAAVPADNPLIGSNAITLDPSASLYGTSPANSAGDFGALGVVTLFDPSLIHDGSGDDGRDGLGPSGPDAPNAPGNMNTPDPADMKDPETGKSFNDQFNDFKDSMTGLFSGRESMFSGGVFGGVRGGSTYGGGDNATSAGPGNASNQGNADNPAQDQVGGIGAGSIGGSGGGSSNSGGPSGGTSNGTDGQGGGTGTGGGEF